MLRDHRHRGFARRNDKEETTETRDRRSEGIDAPEGDVGRTKSIVGSPRTPPGLWDGLIAGGLVLAILTPARTQILRSIGGGSPRLGNAVVDLPDLVVSSVQVVISAQAALYVGSLQGSRVYLRALADAATISADSHSKNNDSSWAIEACSSSNVRHMLASAPLDLSAIPHQYYFAQDPRRQTLESLGAALSACRRLRETHHNEKIDDE
jgi:hypothetical protein